MTGANGVVAEFTAWLTDFLPDDYHDRYCEYRWDLDLRRVPFVESAGGIE